MQKAYSRTNWENYPSDSTPINETNLNKMESGIDEIDNRVITLDTTKATKAEVAALVKDISFEETTGIITITKKNGSVLNIDTKLEKIAVNFLYDKNTQQIILTLIDGTKQYIDLSALITQYEFVDTATIGCQIASDGKVKFTVLDGSITEEKLQPNYLALIKVEVANARNYAAEASTYNDLAAGFKSEAENAASISLESKENAERYATYAGNAADSAREIATAAGTYADTAKESAESASNSAANARNYAAEASNSSVTAQKSSTNADNAAVTARSYSTIASGHADNAKYYYEQAKSISESFAGTLRPKGTVIFADLPSVSSAVEGDMYNISDQFLTTTDFKEGAGNVIPSGANVYKTSDGKWDVLAGSPVTGVKGNVESSYRSGNVNITPEDIGALPLAGGKMTGNITTQNSAAKDIGYFAENTDTNTRVSLMVGAGKKNHGVYSSTLDRWMLYSDGTKIYVNGHTVNSDVPDNAKFTDTTYANATTSANGLMSAADKSSLDKILTDALKLKYIWYANKDAVAEVSNPLKKIGTISSYKEFGNVFMVMYASALVGTVVTPGTASTVTPSTTVGEYTLFNNGDLLAYGGKYAGTEMWKRIPMYEAKTNLDGLMSAWDKQQVNKISSIENTANNALNAANTANNKNSLPVYLYNSDGVQGNWLVNWLFDDGWYLGGITADCGGHPPILNDNGTSWAILVLNGMNTGDANYNHRLQVAFDLVNSKIYMRRGWMSADSWADSWTDVSGVTRKNTITETGLKAVDAVELNPSVAGTLANKIGSIESSMWHLNKRWVHANFLRGSSQYDITESSAMIVDNCASYNDVHNVKMSGSFTITINDATMTYVSIRMEESVSAEFEQALIGTAIATDSTKATIKIDLRGKNSTFVLIFDKAVGTAGQYTFNFVAEALF